MAKECSNNESKSIIQSFSDARSFVRSLFIYGYKHTKKLSLKKKDRANNEYLSKIKNWFDQYKGKYWQASTDPDKAREQISYISVDSHNIGYNPFYTPLKASTFKYNQLAVHFYLLNILHKNCKAMTMAEISGSFGHYESENLYIPTDNILEELLNTYEEQGIITVQHSNPNKYMLSPSLPLDDALLTAIQFFSEVDHLGFFGSTLLDLQPNTESPFVFKHHYLANALNTEIIYQILFAMEQKLLIAINLFDSIKITESHTSKKVIPLKLYRSVETGRMYLLCYSCNRQQYAFFLLDDIDSINWEFENYPTTSELGTIQIASEAEETKQQGSKCVSLVFTCSNYAQLWEQSKEFTKYIWSMSTQKYPEHPSLVTVLFHVEDHEFYIINRLEREKRQGTLTQLDKNTYKYTIKLWNPGEMFPWLRSYITRIININFENKELEQKFWNDFDCMQAIYNLNKEEK